MTNEHVMTFDTVRQRHGDIYAMQILETLEQLVYSEERRKVLLSSPEDRFIEAMTRLEGLEIVRAQMAG